MDTNRAPWLFVIDAVLYVLAAFILYFLLERVFGGSLNAKISLIITASGILSAIFAAHLSRITNKLAFIRDKSIPKYFFVASISIVFGFSPEHRCRSFMKHSHPRLHPQISAQLYLFST